MFKRSTVLSLRETWGSFVKDYYLASSISTQFDFVALAAIQLRQVHNLYFPGSEEMNFCSHENPQAGVELNIFLQSILHR